MVLEELPLSSRLIILIRALPPLLTHELLRRQSPWTSLRCTLRRLLNIVILYQPRDSLRIIYDKVVDVVIIDDVRNLLPFLLRLHLFFPFELHR